MKLVVLSSIVVLLSVSQVALAQDKVTTFVPLAPLDSNVAGQSVIPTITPIPNQNPGQIPSPTQDLPTQTPGQTPDQNPGQHPLPMPAPHKGGKGGSGEFGGGAAEYDQVYYTPAYISRVIAADMKIQCYRGLCEMAMVDTRGHAFVAEVTAGYGQQNGGMGGGMGGGSGVVVVGSGAYNNSPQPYFGVTLRYVTQRCVQSVRVPTSLYVAMNTYLYNLINEDGTTKRTFDPAEQTMILFYTTILKQANGCTTPTR